MTLAEYIRAERDNFADKGLRWPSSGFNRWLDSKDGQAPDWRVVEVTDSANFAHTP